MDFFTGLTSWGIATLIDRASRVDRAGLNDAYVSQCVSKAGRGCLSSQRFFVQVNVTYVRRDRGSGLC